MVLSYSGVAGSDIDFINHGLTHTELQAAGMSAG